MPTARTGTEVWLEYVHRNVTVMRGIKHTVALRTINNKSRWLFYLTDLPDFFFDDCAILAVLNAAILR